MQRRTLSQGVLKRIARQSRPLSPTERSLRCLIKIALIVTALWIFSKSTAAQDTSQFLTSPYYGTTTGTPPGSPGSERLR